MYRGAADYGRDWLDRRYFPNPVRIGFEAALLIVLFIVNGLCLFAPRPELFASVAVLFALAAIGFTAPWQSDRDRGAIVLYGGGALVLVAWAFWLVSDFARVGLTHRHIMISFGALLVVMAWRRHVFRKIWWQVIHTSDAWDEISLCAYSDFLLSERPSPFSDPVALELYRTAAELAMETPDPTYRQVETMRTYAQLLTEGIGAGPDEDEARWWQEKADELAGELHRRKLEAAASDPGFPGARS
ncbi:MAG: hypothetical protein ACR2PM_20410 [Hyphomicrobiales bacterium]